MHFSEAGNDILAAPVDNKRVSRRLSPGIISNKSDFSAFNDHRLILQQALPVHGYHVD
ncbi:hypothetical protein D3C83_277090 [compost metagenome]